LRAAILPLKSQEVKMEKIVLACQIVVALGLLNVWLLRASKPTSWRGGEAKNMLEEFRTYGLPTWFMWVVGFLKVSFALALIAGLWIDQVNRPAATGIAVLMLGAIAMHLKVGDPLRKSMPALSMLLLSLVLVIV
jgi:uncharacterized membrane protein YphA (DoxX/SURF4 family)